MEPDSIALAVDTTDLNVAHRIASLAHSRGAMIKLGLEFSSEHGWKGAGELAHFHDVNWVCDAKLFDIPTTVQRTTANIMRHTQKAPTAITMAAAAGVDAVEAVADVDPFLTVLAVTVLSTVDNTEMLRLTKDRTSRRAMVEDLVDMVLGCTGTKDNVGFVCSGANEIFNIRRIIGDAVMMVPGTRSVGVDANDQKNVLTPAKAVDLGASWLVIGRQVTAADDPAAAFDKLMEELP